MAQKSGGRNGCCCYHYLQNEFGKPTIRCLKAMLTVDSITPIELTPAAWLTYKIKIPFFNLFFFVFFFNWYCTKAIENEQFNHRICFDLQHFPLRVRSSVCVVLWPLRESVCEERHLANYCVCVCVCVSEKVSDDCVCVIALCTVCVYSWVCE